MKWLALFGGLAGVGLYLSQVLFLTKQHLDWLYNNCLLGSIIWSLQPMWLWVPTILAFIYFFRELE